MPYDEKLAGRVRAALAERADVSERRMFGGLAFMVRGHMCCGVIDDDLVLRLGAERADAALQAAHARPMDFTGRPLKGFVYVAADGVRTKAALTSWVAQATDYVDSLPPR